MHHGAQAGTSIIYQGVSIRCSGEVVQIIYFLIVRYDFYRRGLKIWPVLDSYQGARKKKRINILYDTMEIWLPLKVSMLKANHRCPNKLS